MALSRTVPPRARAPFPAAAATAATAATVVCATALVGVGLSALSASAATSAAASTPASAATSAAAPVAAAGTAHAAASTLVTVTVDSVPALSLNAFQGSYATSTVAQNGGDASADGTQDPSGVLDRITVDQPAQSKTHSDPAKNWADAQPSVEYTLHGKKLYSISAVDAHAECTPSSQGASTYVHTAPASVTVLGTKVPTGKSTLPVTGAQLGVTGVDHGSLDVSYTTTATQAQQTANTSGHAHLDLSISGVFYDSAGKQLYSGPVQKLRLGDVQAACQSQSSGATTTPAPTPTTGTSAPGSPLGSTSTSTDSPQNAGPAVPSTLKGAPGPAAYVASPHHARHSGRPRVGDRNEAGPTVPENGTMLPAANAGSASASGGGDASLWWAVLSVLALSCGTGLYFATRRRGRHQ